MQRSPEDAFLAALVGRQAPAGITDGRGRPAPDRLAVYRNNIAASLRDALRATFPATRRLMGDRFFDAAAIDYAAAERPASPLLFRYGATFADFLATLPGLGDYAFVPEVARIEFARVTAHHAADAEPLTGEALAGLSPEALMTVTLSPHPATALVPTPEGGLPAFQANQTPPEAETPAAAALVTRPALNVLVSPLTFETAAFTQKLLDGVPLGMAAEVAGLDLAAALAQLWSAGAFQKRIVPTG